MKDKYSQYIKPKVEQNNVKFVIYQLSGFLGIATVNTLTFPL